MSINQKPTQQTKLKPIQIEIAIIHIANSFLSMGMDIKSHEDVIINKTDSKHTIVLKNILQDIAKKSRLFQRDINRNVQLASDIFHALEKKIQHEIQNPKPKNRFIKTCRLNEDGDLEANAVLLCVLLMREHKHLENKKIFLQYKLADNVISTLLENKTKGYENARVLAKRYVEELKRL